VSKPRHGVGRATNFLALFPLLARPGSRKSLFPGLSWWLNRQFSAFCLPVNRLIHGWPGLCGNSSNEKFKSGNHGGDATGIMKKSIFHHVNTKSPENPPALGTPMGYWSWAAGGSGWQFAREKPSAGDALTTLHRALELGVNWIDTAAVYGVGPTKEIVALALASANPSVGRAQ
jgi:hypothetical protein